MSSKVFELKEQFLREFIVEVPFCGWNEKAFDVVENKLGLQKHYNIMLFPGGIKEVITLFEEQLNSSMKIQCGNLFKDKKIRVRDKIKQAVMWRLIGSKVNKVALASLVKFYYNPMNYNLALKNLWKTVDEIWYLAGDESTDFNYYTKRFLLFSIYKATMLYYISDDSSDSKATEAFLERRIENVMKINKVKSVLPNSLEKIKSKIPFLRLMNRK